MEWSNAGGWLMAHSRPASFHGPAPHTPDGPEIGPLSDEDHEYDVYLRDWDRRVLAGEFDDVEKVEC